MGMGKSVRKEMVEWGILAMVIIILSVVLLQFRGVSNYSCPGSNSSHTLFNESGGGICCHVDLNNSIEVSSCNLNTSVNSRSIIETFITGLNEPQNWIIIVVVGIIGVALVRLFSGSNKD